MFQKYTIENKAGVLFSGYSSNYGGKDIEVDQGRSKENDPARRKRPRSKRV
jgi:hypothetical protein